MNQSTTTWKKAGKLKKGTKFTYNGFEYVITRSGFGTGKYVDVLAELVNGDSGTFCFSKTDDVEVKIK